MLLYRLKTEGFVHSRYGYFFPDGGEMVRTYKCQPGCPVREFEVKHVPPRHLAFTGGELGDFMASIGPVLAKREVAEQLIARFGSLRLQPIKVVKPKAAARARALEDAYVQLEPELEIDPNPELSTLEVKSSCDLCGRRSYDLVGMEEEADTSPYDSSIVLEPAKIRQAGQGIILRRETLDGKSFFKFLGFTICTEEVRTWVQERGFTNTVFLEYGELL